MNKNKRKKEVWIKADEGQWDSKKSRIIAGLEAGADCVLVEGEEVKKVKELGRIRIAAFVEEVENIESKFGIDIGVFGKRSEGDGMKPLPHDFKGSSVLAALKRLSDREKAAYVEIRGKDYERFAVELSEASDYLIIIAKDWKIIPLENILAELQKRGKKVIAGVKTLEEARTAFETLEYGVDGVLIDSEDVSEIKKVVKMREEAQLKKITFSTAKIKEIKPLDMGDRVCVDTCSLMTYGEGMLVGSQSSALFFVHSESEKSPYVEPRPFRVNAGAVHAYVLVGEKTKYLSELESGDEVLIVNAGGNTRKTAVGRVKIEKRPLMFVKAEVEGKKCSVILQNAETIKLMGKEKPISVVDLKEGDEVLVYITEEARHFGISVEEMVIEK